MNTEKSALYRQWLAQCHHFLEVQFCQSCTKHLWTHVQVWNAKTESNTLLISQCNPISGAVYFFMAGFQGVAVIGIFRISVETLNNLMYALSKSLFPFQSCRYFTWSSKGMKKCMVLWVRIRMIWRDWLKRYLNKITKNHLIYDYESLSASSWFTKEQMKTSTYKWL